VHEEVDITRFTYGEEKKGGGSSGGKEFIDYEKVDDSGARRMGERKRISSFFGSEKQRTASAREPSNARAGGHCQKETGNAISLWYERRCARKEGGRLRFCFLGRESGEEALLPSTPKKGGYQNDTKGAA